MPCVPEPRRPIPPDPHCLTLIIHGRHKALRGWRVTTQVEETKCKLVDQGIVALLLGQLQADGASLELVAAACGVVRVGPRALLCLGEGSLQRPRADATMGAEWCVAAGPQWPAGWRREMLAY
jgi:hypothetical protein